MKFFVAALLGLTMLAHADEFPISFWCGPPAKFLTLERFKEIKDAGFTFVMPSCGGTTREDNLKILDFCEQVGLKAVIADKRIGLSKNEKSLDEVIADYAKHPALLGYYITDEPGAKTFTGLGEVVAYLKEHDPKHVAFINLFPNYANGAMLQVPSYKQYVEEYIAKVKPSFVSYDHYAMEAKGDRPGFFENLELVRDATAKHDIRFWQIVLVVQHGGYRNLTEGELRFEAMQTRAYGGKGLLWFTYWSPAESDKSFEWKHAMINPDGTRDPHWEMVARVNKEVQAIGSELMNTKLTLMHPISVNTNPAYRTTITEFKTQDGKTLAMFASQNYKDAIDFAPLIDLDGKVDQLDLTTGKWNTIAHHKTDPVKLQLAPGGAALLRW